MIVGEEHAEKVIGVAEALDVADYGSCGACGAGLNHAGAEDYLALVYCSIFQQNLLTL
jgi:hypothetical protein